MWQTQGLRQKTMVYVINWLASFSKYLYYMQKKKKQLKIKQTKTQPQKYLERQNPRYITFHMHIYITCIYNIHLMQEARIWDRNTVRDKENLLLWNPIPWTSELL